MIGMVLKDQWCEVCRKSVTMIPTGNHFTPQWECAECGQLYGVKGD